MHRPTNLPSVPLPSAARDRVTEEVSTNRKPLVQIRSKKKTTRFTAVLDCQNLPYQYFDSLNSTYHLFI